MVNSEQQDLSLSLSLSLSWQKDVRIPWRADKFENPVVVFVTFCNKRKQVSPLYAFHLLRLTRNSETNTHAYADAIPFTHPSNPNFPNFHHY